MLVAKQNIFTDDNLLTHSPFYVAYGQVIIRLTLFWKKRVRLYDSAEKSIHKTFLFVSCHRQHFFSYNLFIRKQQTFKNQMLETHHLVSSVISPVTNLVRVTDRRCNCRL